MLGKQLQGQPSPRSHRPALVVYVPETGPRFPEAPLLHPLALGGRMGRGSRGSRGDGGAGNGGLYPIGRWSRCRRLLVGTGGGVEKVSVVHPGDRDNGGHFRGSLWEVSRGVVAVSGQVTCPRQLSEAVGGQRAGRGRQALGEQGPLLGATWAGLGGPWWRALPRAWGQCWWPGADRAALSSGVAAGAGEPRAGPGLLRPGRSAPPAPGSECTELPFHGTCVAGLREGLDPCSAVLREAAGEAARFPRR